MKKTRIVQSENGNPVGWKLWFLFALVLSLALLPLFCRTASAGHHDDDYGEYSGESWTLVSGTLTISGTGDIPDYSCYDEHNDLADGCAPWFRHADQIVRVVIEEGVTGIGDFAFQDCLNLTEISIPEGVTRIGRYAFRHCWLLPEITFPDSVTIVDDLAFEYCDALRSIRLGENVTYLGMFAFDGGSDLTMVTIFNPQILIGDSAFWGCNQNLVIFGYSGSTAETYAVNNRITFRALPALSGTGSPDDPWLIETADHWATAVNVVNQGWPGDTCFRLAGEITVSSVMGSPEHPFTGVFDGGGHTLTVALASGADFCAPFSEIGSGTVIRNLKTAGTVAGGMHCSGLVGAVRGSSRIENCAVSVSVSTSGTHCGGFVGHGGTSAVSITGCLFSGSITGPRYAGTFWGWSDEGAAPTLTNCLDVSTCAFPVGLGYDDPVNGVVNTFYTFAGKSSGAARSWTSRGILPRTVSPDTGVAISSPDGTVYGASGITSLPSGLLYRGTLYAAEGANIILSLSADMPEAFPLGGFTVNAGTLSEENGLWSLTVPGENVIISPVAGFGNPDFVLPSSLTGVAAEAFRGIAAEIVQVPASCKAIGDYAFRDCASLWQICIPADCTVGTDAFDGCDTVFVFSAVGSPAQAYCDAHENCVFVEWAPD